MRARWSIGYRYSCYWCHRRYDFGECDIRDAFPDASLTLFTSKANASVAPLITAINEAIVLPIMCPWRALAQLRRRRFDWLIDLGPWPRINAVFSGLSGSRNTVGFKTRGQCRHMVYDHVVNHRSDRHQLENLRALVEPLNIPDPTSSNQDPKAHLPMPLPRVLLWYSRMARRLQIAQQGVVRRTLASSWATGARIGLDDRFDRRSE